jgi:DNA-binding CsgD family transcriptional regulator
MRGRIAGRDAELASVREFVASVTDGAAALVLQGEAGVGKTTVWSEAIVLAEAQGCRVLRTRPAESETTLSFSALGDLLEPVADDALAALPEAQRRALAVALLIEEADGLPLDGRAVGVALVNALRSLSSAAPLVVAVDDVHWLDRASEAALVYAARRLTVEPVGLLLARRAPLESALVADLQRSLADERFLPLDVTPLDTEALHRVIHEHLRLTLPRPRLAEVHAASGGNPFYALELVRMLQRSGVSPDALQPLPLPDSLRDLVRGRLVALPPESRDLLLVVAAHAQASLSLAEAASGVGWRDGLAPALDAGVVQLDGERIRFTHPLLAAGAYETADPDRRRAVHRRLADLVADPETRAWQLAAGATEPDEDVALALEQAAEHARARGAPSTAALLLDRASELTPDDGRDDAVRRAVDAAYLHYESGDSPRAQERLGAIVAELPFGRARARALMRLARVRAYVHLVDAAALFLCAVEEAEGDAEILAVAHEGVATCLFRRYERLLESVEHAEAAAELATELGDAALAAEALGTQWVVEVLLGRDFTHAAERALALQDATADRRVLAQPRFAAAASQLWLTSSLPLARDELVDLLRRAAELGDESSPPLVLAHVAEVECELGHLDAAHAHALEGQEAARQSGQETVFAHNLAVEALVDAYRGNSERARALALRALDLVPATGGRQAEFTATRAIGHLELSIGRPEAVVATLEPTVAFVREQGIAEPGLVPFASDLAEALIELGRRDEAMELLDWYEGNAARLGRASALARAVRCRGLLAASAANLDDAILAFERALGWHAQVTIPLDPARTLLALGATQRRAKRRRAARETLEGALAAFERIGAAVWAGRARAELARISGRAPSAGELTPAEERVAALVAEGKSNREVAAMLYLSDKTVEGHLSRIFGKLGVKSRADVARALNSRHGA